jgi:hypothetical protein
MAFSRLSESGCSQVMNDLASWSIKLAVQTICEGWPETRFEGLRKSLSRTSIMHKRSSASISACAHPPVNRPRAH